jgi:peptidoglycan/LPS O-acetylase OafA/YrhL
MKMKSQYIPELDGLKGLCILSILVYATFAFPYSFELILPAPHGFDYWTQGFLGMGWVGREFFMVIAGFLTTQSLQDSAPILPFYQRRLLRIGPAYFAFLAALSLPYLSINVPGVLSLWTFTSNFVAGIYGISALPQTLDHLWLVSVFMQFYLIWPLVIRLSGRNLQWVCIVLILASPLARGLIVEHDGTWRESMVYLTPFHLDLFAWGALVAATGDRVVGSRWMPAILGLSLAGTAMFFVTNPGFNWNDVKVMDHGLRILGLFFASTLTVLIPLKPNKSRKNILARLLGFPFLQWFGRYSFGLFLVHQPVIIYLLKVAYLPAPGWSPLILFSSLTIGLSFLLALVIYDLIERRFLI